MPRLVMAGHPDSKEARDGAGKSVMENLRICRRRHGL
jgi:hypothetical protein